MEEIFCHKCNRIIEKGEILKVLISRMKYNGEMIECAERGYHYCEKCASEGVMVKVNEMKR